MKLVARCYIQKNFSLSIFLIKKVLININIKYYLSIVLKITKNQAFMQTWKPKLSQYLFLGKNHVSAENPRKTK